MTENYLKKQKEVMHIKNPHAMHEALIKCRVQEEYSNKMIKIMKEMQSPQRFNSPLRKRNLFNGKPLPIHSGDRIIQGIPIEIRCDDNFLDCEGEPALKEELMAAMQNVDVSPEDVNNSYIMMNNEEDHLLREGHSFGEA
jgi:hypothetical protein